MEGVSPAIKDLQSPLPVSNSGQGSIQQLLDNFFKTTTDDAALQNQVLTPPSHHSKICVEAFAEESSYSHKGSGVLCKPQTPNSEDTLPKEVSVKYYARSANIKNEDGKEDGMYELKEVTEHKTVKGIKGFLYKCIWENENQEPTWEPECNIKPTADKALNLYWRSATKSAKPEPNPNPAVQTTPLSTPLKQTLLTKKITSERRVSHAIADAAPVPSPNSALTVLNVSQKPINCCTPESSPDKITPTKLQTYESQIVNFDDIETAFLSNIGNWKKLRRLDNKDIYKCSECDYKLEAEKKGAQIRVKTRNPISDEAHNWFDQIHLAPFREDSENRAERMHSSIEAYIKLQIRANEDDFIHPDELIEKLRRERSKLYQYFKPTMQQLAFFLMSNCRKADLAQHGAFLSSLLEEKPSPMQQLLLDLESDSSSSGSKKRYNKKPALILASSSDEEQRSNNQKSPQAKPSNLKTSIEQLEKATLPESLSNGKRVKFNKYIEQIDFLKQAVIFDEGTGAKEPEQESQESSSSSEEDETNKRKKTLGLISASQESSSQSESSQQSQAWEDVSSDEEELENGSFLEMIKNETEKAVKERHFLMKELRAKERRGSIFIDKVKRVVAAVQRVPGKFDYLIEWEFHPSDRITPSATLVRGSHFAFSNPLLYRRYVEKQFVQIRSEKDGVKEGLIINRK
ncbi:hypothetical protein FGO68_gene3475 [Halteria grandinella]|uniref:Chromo domain-containing protein n=1 Tax=Halteria grandinella TaxID=5974 RepID=A0A8J8T580_HALGN|nr:hypothetical protein FGO68_gene3475 [Halteria grandinella]